MKNLLVILWFIPCVSNGQSLNRLVYEKYFKALYPYEPAMIRENKIEYLETTETEIQGDSVTYTALKERVTFRKDGRPVSRILWTNFHRDSVMFDYTYDSLGNLLEYRQWQRKNVRYMNDVQIDIVRNSFRYENNLPVRVFCYSSQNEDGYLKLTRCDSLTYTHGKTLKITYGNEKNSTIGFRNDQRFVYPVISDYSPEYIATEEDIPAKPIDRESCWNTGCSYADKPLKEIQRRTGIACIPDRFVEAFYREALNAFSADPNKEGAFFIDYKSGLNHNTIFIDTVKQRIFLKEQWFTSEPTSMENRNTTSNSTHQFDYSFRVLHTETVVEVSRGDHEHFVDNFQIDYTYFEFGLLEQKRRAPNGRADWQADLIVEEKTTIKRW